MEHYKNVLGEFTDSSNDFFWVSRPIEFTTSYRKNKTTITPSEVKNLVYKSVQLKKALEEAFKENSRKHLMKSNILDIIEEIGYDYNLSVIRCLGYVLIKILKKSLSGLYVNELQLMKIKNEMGNTPFVFVPTHRSYGDFILMAFICFYYCINIPCVAAGMDFLSMRFMNKVLRNSKAFFMRRKFREDTLYRAIFKEYIRTLISYADSPVEFFIEGTRSRTGKSLMPKYGLISMLVDAYLSGDIPDLKLVPISISYDRLLEEKLFGYELMGIPKPKESTWGLIKGLSVMKGNYGKIFVNFGEPFSIRTFFNGTNDFRFCTREYGSAQMQNLAFNIIKKQQQLNVYGTFNLLALVLNDCVVGSKTYQISLQEAIKQFKKLQFIFDKIGATVYVEGDIEEEIRDSIATHSSLVEIANDNVIFLNSDLKEDILTGNSSQENALKKYVPFIMLQIYVNPSMNLFVKESIVISILKKVNVHTEASRDYIFENYQYLCRIFKHEFVLAVKIEEYYGCLMNLKQIDLIQMEGHIIKLNHNDITKFYINLIKPFIIGIYTFCTFLNEFHNKIMKKSQADIIKMVQLYTQGLLMTDSVCHPYCLSVEFISNTFNSFYELGLFQSIGSRDFRVNERHLNSLMDYLGCLVNDTGYLNQHKDTNTNILHLYSKL